MKYAIAVAAVLLLHVTSSASAQSCAWDVNYDTPIGKNDPAGQQLRCWVQLQGGEWQCSQHECTNSKYPEWTYRATLSVCSGDTCSQTVINASGDVVVSSTSTRGPNSFTTVHSVDYEGNRWACETVSDSPGSGSGVFYTIVCPE